MILQLVSNNSCNLNLSFLKEFCQTLESLFGKISEINIAICNSPKELKKCAGEGLENLPKWVVGLTKENFVYLIKPEIIRKRKMQFEEICRHEIIHVFINKFSNGCPIWLNEGIAQSLSENKPTKKDTFGVELINPYNLNYESGLYFCSKLVVEKLFESYGISNVINHLKNCKDFKNDNIFGYCAIDTLVKDLRGEIFNERI